MSEKNNSKVNERKIYKFLNIEWFDLVLNHRHFIGDKVSNEIKRPINRVLLYH